MFGKHKYGDRNEFHSRGRVVVRQQHAQDDCGQGGSGIKGGGKDSLNFILRGFGNLEKH